VEVVRAACILFNRDPAHPSLRRHRLDDNKKASHARGNFSVSPSMQYRAIYTTNDDGINIWHWIGTHAEYKRFTGSKK
jgi:hypothetical protein